MKQNCILSPERRLTDIEQSLVWQKPASHIDSEAEKRIYNEVVKNWNRGEMKISTILLEGDAGSGKTQIAKALSADFNMPYTKVTCFADMDKSDVLGSILPVLSEKDESDESDTVEYKYYPSEIVRAYENGWLLEIQEPTVIRDAAVLMALNSALEPDGSLNLPTRIARRHPDFVAVITTNRGYNGYRPLNEALRDRVQHAEKLDLPPKEVMIERAQAKTGYENENVLFILADTIILLDETARANAIKGVAGMRSYIFWADAVAGGASMRSSLYYKVLYKITTDPQELAILEHALSSLGLIDLIDSLDKLEESELDNKLNCNTSGDNPEVMELNISENGEYEAEADKSGNNAIRMRKSADSEGHSDTSSDKTTDVSSNDNGENGTPFYHELDKPVTDEEKRGFRKKLNKEARKSVQGSCHEETKLIVHRPEVTAQYREEYGRMAAELRPVIMELIRKTNPLLEHELSAEFAKSQLYGTKFCAEKAASVDFRVFARKRPPEEEPSLAVALRIDESASMSAFGRLEAARQAAVALYEFCTGCGIPIMVYGDTADRSKLEQMSVYAYVDFESRDADDKYALMNIQARSNNRDGMALRIIGDRLINAPQKTKLIISISDGQPKAMPDYSGEKAVRDMKDTLQEYRRKGIQFLAAAIGQDKEDIRGLYGAENTLDIDDLKELPSRLVQIIARFL